MFERHGRFQQHMQFSFDAEFMLRLVLAGELPVLLPEARLSARVFHPAAKSADPSQTDRDLKRVVKFLTPSLSRRERVLLRLHPLIVRLQFLTRPTWMLHRVATLAGDLLGHVPEPIRPKKMRTRDRRAR
jgi:hypothetical protein